MKHRELSLIFTLALALALSGCAPQSVNPLAKNEATPVPGLSMNLHAASASDSNVDQVNVTLYFRYLDEPYLAPENRILTVKQDESVELAIAQALADGPSAGHSDLKRLIPAAALVESVTSRDDILFVTFNEGFLRDDVPDSWMTDENWREEAPTLRKLIVQSIAASMTEYAPYTGIQILVHKHDEVQTSLRLDNSYFLTGATGLSEPVQRDESALLTPQRTAEILLTAWQQRDHKRLYRFIAQENKPSYTTAAETFSVAPALESFTVSSGSVSYDGQTATLCANLKTVKDGVTSEVDHYPLQLIRENGVWKISAPRLASVMNR